MQPIFIEYIRFLNDHNCNTEWFRENVFWLDNNIVKAFKRGGQVISLYRVSVDDKLNLKLTKPSKIKTILILKHGKKPSIEIKIGLSNWKKRVYVYDNNMDCIQNAELLILILRVKIVWLLLILRKKQI